MRTRLLFLTTALTLAWLAAAVQPASAQIYAWRDDDGHLVVSDHERGGSSRGYAATGTTYQVADSSFRNDAAVHQRCPLRRYHPRARRTSRPQPRSRDGRDSGRVRVQSAGAVAEGRDGVDAADAIDRHGIRCSASVRSRREHRCGRRVSAPADGPVRRTGRARAGGVQRRTRRQSTSTARPCLPYQETRNYVRKIKSVTPISLGARRVIQDRRDRRRTRSAPLLRREARRRLHRRHPPVACRSILS